MVSIYPPTPGPSLGTTYNQSPLAQASPNNSGNTIIAKACQLVAPILLSREDGVGNARFRAVLVGKLLEPTAIGGSPWSIVGTLHSPDSGVLVSCIDPRVNCPSGIHAGKLRDRTGRQPSDHVAHGRGSNTNRQRQAQQG